MAVIEDETIHWTENWVIEDVDENDKPIFNFYNPDSELLGSRVNKLMAQVALMDYCAVNMDSYNTNPVNYLISLHKLITTYNKRLSDIGSTQDVIHAHTEV